MAIKDLISSIILNDEFSDTFNKYNTRLEGSDRVSNKFAASLAKVGAGLAIATGAAAGILMAIDRLTQSAVENQAAMFNVAASAQAASSEFGDSVGSVESWIASVKETSDALRVFSDRDVAEATSSIIDMTKRLGLTEKEMKDVLLRTGDLSAGKFKLKEALDKTAGALRGETDAAEALGLALSIPQMTAYAESLGLVFSELSAGEQEQLRFQQFLKQTDALQGRAAESAKTLGGAEAELARLRQREIDQIGNAMVPLRQGEIALWQRLAGASLSAGDVIAKVMAGIQTAMVVSLLTIKAMTDSLKSLGIVGKAAFDAIRSGESPVEAIKAAAVATRDLRGTLTGLATDFGGTITETYNQLLAGNEAAIEAQVDLGGEFQNTGQAAQSAYSAAGDAAQEFLDKVGEVKEEQAKLIDRFNNRIAQAEFAHQQRLVRLNEAAQQAIADATAQAAEARIASAQKVAEGLASINSDLASNIADINSDLAADLSSIESDLSSDRKKIIEDFNRDIDKLNQNRADSERKASRALTKLETDRQQKIDDINQDLADKLGDKAAKTEAQKLKILASGGERIIALEKSIADRRNAINDKFSSEFENADAFKRKILEFNRAEELKQLEQAGAEEKSEQESQNDEALTELEARVAAETAILEREAEQKKARLERENQDRKDAIAQQLADDLETSERRQAELEGALERELAAKKEAAEKERAAKLAAAEQEKADKLAAAEEARVALAEKHAEELAKIDEQEQKKIEQASKAIEREKRNHADKLAALRNAHTSELTEIKDKLAEVEQAEADSQEERLNRTRAFSAEMQRLNGLAAFYQGGGGAGSPSSTTIGSNPGDASAGIAGGTVIVNQYGTGEGYAGAQQTGRTLLDTLENRA